MASKKLNYFPLIGAWGYTSAVDSAQRNHCDINFQNKSRVNDADGIMDCPHLLYIFFPTICSCAKTNYNQKLSRLWAARIAYPMVNDVAVRQDRSAKSPGPHPKIRRACPSAQLCFASVASRRAISFCHATPWADAILVVCPVYGLCGLLVINSIRQVQSYVVQPHRKGILGPLHKRHTHMHNHINKHTTADYTTSPKSKTNDV